MQGVLCRYGGEEQKGHRRIHKESVNRGRNDGPDDDEGIYGPVYG